MAKAKENEHLNSLVKFLSENSIAELEQEKKGKKFSIKIKHFAREATKKEEISTKETAKKPEIKPEAKTEIQETYILTSQHVGYFHILRQEKDNIEPFAKVGDKVHLEDILGIIDCMKGQVQHEIRLADYKDFKSEYGIIEKIYVENGMPVEYGKPLFEIKSLKE